MAKSQDHVDSKPPRAPRAKTVDGRENQLIAMAYDHAEEQFRNGTATSQLTTHFLKAGTAREELEREVLRNKNLLLEAQIQEIKSRESLEETYQEAIDAMRVYSGNGSIQEAFEDEDVY